MRRIRDFKCSDTDVSCVNPNGHRIDVTVKTGWEYESEIVSAVFTYNIRHVDLGKALENIAHVFSDRPFDLTIGI